LPVGYTGFDEPILDGLRCHFFYLGVRMSGERDKFDDDAPAVMGGDPGDWPPTEETPREGKSKRTRAKAAPAAAAAAPAPPAPPSEPEDVDRNVSRPTSKAAAPKRWRVVERVLVVWNRCPTYLEVGQVVTEALYGRGCYEALLEQGVKMEEF
jgi:hypothetical protein